MFPAFCLATYFLFSSYWLLKKNISKSQKQKQDVLIQGQVISAETKIEKNNQQKSDQIHEKAQVDQQQISNHSVKDELDIAMIQNQELDKNIQQEEPLLKQNIINEENQIISSDVKEANEKEEKTYKPILKNLVDNNQEYESDEDPPSPFQSYLIEKEKRLKQQRVSEEIHRYSDEQKPEEQSEFQLIQALSNQRKSNKLNQPSSQIIPEVDHKQREEDTGVATLIQQMDSLFQNNPSSFLRLMNRYKIQQSPDLMKNINHNKQQILTEMQEKIQQLKMELERKSSQVGIKQIQIFQYKSVSDGKQAEVEALKAQKGQLEQKISALQKQNIQLRQKLYKKSDNSILKQKKDIQQITNTEKQKQLEKMVQQYKIRNEELQGQLQQLQFGVTDIELKELFFQNERKGQEQKLLQYKIQLKSKDKQINALKQELSASNQKMESQYKNKLEELKLQMQNVKKQSNQQKNKQQLLSVKSNNSNLQLQIEQKQKNENCAYFPISTRQNLGQSSISEGNQKYSNEDIRQLHKTIQNLKNEIEFSQTQMRMLQNSEANHLQKIQYLQKTIEQRSSPEVMDLRAKIFRLQPLADQYEVMRKKYLQMKINYQTLIHQKQKKQEKISAYFNSQRESPTSQIIPTSLNRKQSKQPYNNQNSPVSNGNSALSHSQSNESKNNGCYRFLFDCEFVIYEERQFIYDTLSKLLKGIIKTEKLYNSKIDIEKNPHQIIDNIRGILVMIQLKNNKIIGAYTHEAFSQIHPNSTKQNIGFIIDVMNRKSFANQSGINSISYSPKSLVWGLNQIMLKYQEPQILYTNFCRNHNIYWDGKHKIEQFIGQQKQWAPIVQYEVFRVSKI